MISVRVVCGEAVYIKIPDIVVVDDGRTAEDNVAETDFIGFDDAAVKYIMRAAVVGIGRDSSRGGGETSGEMQMCVRVVEISITDNTADNHSVLHGIGITAEIIRIIIPRMIVIGHIEELRLNAGVCILARIDQNGSG